MSMQRWFAHAETRARAPKDSHSHPRSPSFLHLKGAFVPKRHFCSVFTAGLLRDSDPAGREGVGVGLGGSPTSRRLTSDRLQRRPGPGGRRDGGTAGAGRWCLFFLFSTFTSSTGCQRRPAAPSCSAGSTSSPPPVQYCSVCVLGAASAHRNVPCSAFPFSARPPRGPASVGFYVRVFFQRFNMSGKKERKSLFSKKNRGKKRIHSSL